VRTHARAAAFTLIEVICVIIILSVLVAMLAPVAVRVKDASKRAAAMSNLRQLYVSFDLYRTDYDGQDVYGPASAMGLPDISMIYGTPGPSALFPKTEGSWASPCGQHPDTLPLDRAGTNLSYFATDLKDEYWPTYAPQKGPAAVFLADENCNPPSVVIGTEYYPTFHLGVTIDGTVRRKTCTNGEIGFLVWVFER
jgi:prepilin-type N-terminal cleavage/methylation domain-containing protein